MEVAGSHPTLAHLLQSHARIDPGRTAYVFLEDGESETARMTYSELDERARSIAWQLASLGARGERALLIYPSGLDFVAALFGCFYAGVIAVPAIPEQSPRAIERFRKVISDSQASLVLTTEVLFRTVTQALPKAEGLHSLHWVVTDKPTKGPNAILDFLSDNVDELAFIQYTSGSTSEPKGIAVSHANLMYNQAMFEAGMETNPGTTIVTWLPIYHDLGLIGQLLHAVYVGGLCVLMPPLAFLQKPIRWLTAISAYRGTYSAAPNFGYELCLKRINPSDCNGLDLSSWSVAMNAAEPVRNDTVRRFEARFERWGFSRHTFFPAYGLAEATICVSGGPCNQGAVTIAIDSDALARHRVKLVEPATPNARIVVACGERQLDEEILIVDPEICRRLERNSVGEIWIRGPNVAKGYWNQPIATEETFSARLSDSGDGPFLRTGDLGFLRDGQLYVTGRIKDLIVVRGRNHYPQDIELTAERSHRDVRPGCGAAFATTTRGMDRVVLVQEIRECEQLDYASIASTIRRAVIEDHGIALQSIVLVPPRTVPKTSSGKIARSACRDAYLQRAIPVAHEWAMESVADGSTSVQHGSRSNA